jgi:hypothetical protein
MIIIAANVRGERMIIHKTSDVTTLYQTYACLWEVA